jgi:hypothetical protein
MSGKPKQIPEALAQFAAIEAEDEEALELDETDTDVTLEEDDEMADSGVMDGQTLASTNSHEDDYADEDDPGKV